MKHFGWLAIALIVVPATLWAQAPDTTQVVSPAPAVAASKPSTASKIYYGGTIGFNFGDFFRISLSPMVGYRFTPKVSGGVKVAYEYVRDSRYAETYTSHNFGGSAFGRYRIIPQLYAHAEFAYVGYDLSVTGSEREWVPFLLLGGGYVQRISPRASAYVEVLFDVLQDSKSPYENWDPWVSIGVGVGF